MREPTGGHNTAHMTRLGDEEVKEQRVEGEREGTREWCYGKKGEGLEDEGMW